MPQTLTAVPNLKLPGRQVREIKRRSASQLRGLELRQFPAGERIALFPEINLRIPVGKLLALLTVIVFGLLLVGHFAQVGAFLSSFIYDPANASISGDPVITGMVDWFPILLVGLSAVVLAGLTINRVLYRRDLRQAGPRLVSKSARSSEIPGKPAVVPAPRHTRAATSDQFSAPQDASHLFLVPSTPENRHEAQEQVRLERDARASALARATEAARLVISGSVRLHQSEALVVPKPRRTLASMPPQAPPPQPYSGVFFPELAASTKKPAPINAPRFRLSRAPYTPPAIL